MQAQSNKTATTLEHLRVSHCKERCRVLGPGVRAVIWFHGCSLACKGCIAAEMNASTRYLAHTPESLAEWVLRIDGIEGITLSGGDPFDQPKKTLAAFLAMIRERSDLSVMMYTGRTFEQLQSADDAEDNANVLRHADILVDGPYIESLNEGHLWRGSSNQRLYCLTGRYRPLMAAVREARSREIEMNLSLDGDLTIAGIPRRGFMPSLIEQLDRRGVRFSFKAGS